MNERIKLLAVAAAPANSSIPHSEWNIPKEFIERFAELIIEECISIIYDQEKLPVGFTQPKLASNYEFVIKQHFDIKS